MPIKEGGVTPARSIFVSRSASTDERRYFDMIDRAFAGKSDRIIRNGEPAHAVYLIGKFLDTAEQKILVCTGKLSQEFDGVMAWGDPHIAESAKRFLAERGGKIRIVITNGPDIDEGQKIEDHPFLRQLVDSEIGEGRVDVYRHAESASLPHYITMDGEALRIEVDPEKAKAYVNLNDRETCDMLQGIFDNQSEAGEHLLSIPVPASA